MPSNHQKTMLGDSSMLSPCPFSKGYKIPVQQAWLQLKGFNIYRLILACLFLGVYYSPLSAVVITSAYEKLYFYASFSYFFIALLS